ncbi:hypothetical protein NLI96_g6739 [Meripilus lineatus]|uniref:Uncharacterized protein n=1 Tax=Meripilus lineatus TaxID=2056292 RepID=A0AAD5YFM7_9APHY|nr:hypothetical protein NLI96_g6739 [Physisporinus lineatus]
MPTTLVFQAFYQILPELYLNSLLATFNARENFRMQMSTNEHLSLPLSSLPGTHLNLQSHHEQSKVIDIQVDTIMERKHDHDLMVRTNSFQEGSA